MFDDDDDRPPSAWLLTGAKCDAEWRRLIGPPPPPLVSTRGILCKICGEPCSPPRMTCSDACDLKDSSLSGKWRRS